MRILHICDDFFISSVHLPLYKELDKLGAEQIFFSPTDYEDKNLELTFYYYFKFYGWQSSYFKKVLKFAIGNIHFKMLT